MVTKQKLVDDLRDAIIKLHNEHSDLFERGVREEAITFHLAGYLYDELDVGADDLNLDVEYNKNQDDPKDLDIQDQVLREVEDELPQFGLSSVELEMDDLINDQEQEDIRPDIVLHERGTHESNVFIAEIKKTEDDIDKKDAAKVLCLTHSGSDYKYDWGALVPLEPEFLHEEGLFWVEEGEVQRRISFDVD